MNKKEVHSSGAFDLTKSLQYYSNCLHLSLLSLLFKSQKITGRDTANNSNTQQNQFSISNDEAPYYITVQSNGKKHDKFPPASTSSMAEGDTQQKKIYPELNSSPRKVSLFSCFKTSLSKKQKQLIANRPASNVTENMANSNIFHMDKDDNFRHNRTVSTSESLLTSDKILGHGERILLYSPTEAAAHSKMNPLPRKSLRDIVTDMKETRPAALLEREIQKLGPPHRLTRTIQVVNVIHSGRFGYVFRAQYGHGRLYAAVKCNANSRGYHSKCGDHCSDLSHEEVVIRRLSEERGFAKYYTKFHCGLLGGVPYSFLVMELLGPNLRQLFEYCNRRLSNKSILMLAAQMIKRLQTLHNINIIHRDLKPENFTMGCGRNMNTVYLIDFAKAKPLSDDYDKTEDKGFLVGSIKYASLRAQETNNRRKIDDIESLAYVLLYLNQGCLPWIPKSSRGRQIKTDPEYYYDKKMTLNVEQDCGRSPKSIRDMLTFARETKYDTEPNYDQIKRSFMLEMKALNFRYDSQYDWMKIYNLRYNKSKFGV